MDALPTDYMKIKEEEKGKMTYILVACRPSGTFSIDILDIFVSCTCQCRIHCRTCTGKLHFSLYSAGRILFDFDLYNFKHLWNDSNEMKYMLLFTFASFTGEGVVMITGSSITANQTQFFLLSRYGTFFLLGIGKTVNRITTAAIDTTRRRQIFSTFLFFEKIKNKNKNNKKFANEYKWKTSVVSNEINMSIYFFWK